MSMNAPVETLADLSRVAGKAELVAGRIVPLEPTGFLPGQVGGRIYKHLDDHGIAVGRGVALPIVISVPQSLKNISLHRSPWKMMRSVT